ncbi:MAG: hypothetical protein EZS28_047965 [Streblomastix strix]|uniref:Uncharacterized protein n=1 Tax=Streblomastix strix TaxID=222440 RepID=A0A5J4TEB4_9EUKA|nr:MAG: hypothetical protein EZS28_047965 [Streblomastix strix]
MLFPMRSEFVSQVGKKLSVGIHSAKFSPFANAVAVRFLDKTFSIWEVDPQNMQTAEHEEEGESMQKDESVEKAGVLFKFVCQIQS